MKTLTAALVICMVSCSGDELPPRKARRLVFEYEQNEQGRMIITNEQFADWIGTHCEIRQTDLTGNARLMIPGATTLRLYCQADPVGPVKP